MKTILLSFVNQIFFITCIHFLVFSISPANAQDQANKKIISELIYATDSILGSDDELFNGVIYHQGHIGSKGNPFYLSSEWQPTVLVVNGKTHDHQYAKYNIETNELIVILAQQGGTTYPTVLNNDFIDEFNLNEHHFVNNKYLKIPGEKMDFLEKIYLGSFSFYSSYGKEFLKVYNSKNPQGKYSETSTAYYLIENGNIQNMASVKSLIKYLGTDKKALKSFLKENNIKFKKASVKELKSVLEYCDKLRR